MPADGELINRLIDVLSRYLHGKVKALRNSIVCALSRGHLLIEDLPGLGKTTLAIGIAKALGLSFSRIQCTSDLLPSDITGLSIYNKTTGEFEFHPGPIFNNIILVDEINRATPKTQSALLEGMGEKQVTIEGKTYKLPKPFFVIATQNPIEHYGTFPLPESQMDRFMMKISVGYPPRQAEKQILSGGSTREELYSMEPVIEKDEVINFQERIRNEVYLSEKILDYVLDIVEATRSNSYLLSGLSTRGSLAIIGTAKASAFLSGRDFVIPEDIRELAPFTIPHRIVCREEYLHLDRRELVAALMEKIPAPL